MSSTFHFKIPYPHLAVPAHLTVPEFVKDLFPPTTKKYHLKINKPEDIEKLHNQIEEMQKVMEREIYKQRLKRQYEVTSNLNNDREDRESPEEVNLLVNIISDGTHRESREMSRSTSSAMVNAIEKFDKQPNNHLYNIESGDSSEIGGESDEFDDHCT